MAEAFRCDGCGEFFEGEPQFKVTRPYLTVADPIDGWTFHQVGCIILWANRRVQEK